ncbi:universal stress protein [Pseudoduganella buxea]|uniref:Universal stress protein n=1 Tax=Pseudoduganella buxea TaxID=1949069 RepID=A0A6I3T824_9BURK|nr:universal stress protein [Pseudoduganella buxea]MTV55747.1 universal stress protein [Pseudoduganella buxea]GGC13348.1 universal stress protein A [Pseudoduganella buxea]
MYKTIVLYVADNDQFALRMRLATGLAERHGAHLVGCAATGLAPADYAMLAASPFGAMPLADHAALHDDAAAALERFTVDARRRGVASFETRLVTGHAAEVVLAQSTYADLVIVGQDNGTAVLTGFAVPDYVALHGACPVLMVPDGCRADSVGRRILIGWNASLEARRAVQAALPLLRDAAHVHAAVIDRPSPWLHGDDPTDRDPGAALAAWLGRLGVPVQIVTDPDAHHAGDALLRIARDVDADLVVAGAYGHSRFRELVAGGATRTLLDNAETCVLLTH